MTDAHRPSHPEAHQALADALVLERHTSHEAARQRLCDAIALVTGGER